MHGLQQILYVSTRTLAALKGWHGAVHDAKESTMKADWVCKVQQAQCVGCSGAGSPRGLLSRAAGAHGAAMVSTAARVTSAVRHCSRLGSLLRV